MSDILNKAINYVERQNINKEELKKAALDVIMQEFEKEGEFEFIKLNHKHVDGYIKNIRPVSNKRVWVNEYDVIFLVVKESSYTYEAGLISLGCVKGLYTCLAEIINNQKEISFLKDFLKNKNVNEVLL